jgi:TonB-like protein
MGLVGAMAATRAILLLALGSTSWSFPQSPDGRIIVDDLTSMKAEFTLTCLVGRRELKEEESDSPVILDPSEMKRRATHTASISVPPGTVPADTVTVYVLIDEKGSVACASLTKNSQDRLARVGALALEAAKKWVFQPVLNDTKPVLCIGELELRVVVEDSIVKRPAARTR